MPKSRIMRALASGAALAILLSAHGSPAKADRGGDDTVASSFEGGQIRLADGWGKANACTSDEAGTRCYRTEAEMDDAERVIDAGRGMSSTLADCATPGVRLYRSTSHGGQVLQLLTRNTYISLIPYGFDNDTSSYKIGACSAGFYDTSTGGTAYPGSTSAGVSATSMLSGWDNRVSSVYIF